MNLRPNGIVVSLNFRVAHVAHLVASYKQLEDLGYDAYLLIHPDIIPYLPSGIKYVTTIDSIKHIDLAIFWFPAKSNVKMMWKLKSKHNCKIIYVLHEPLESFTKYRHANLSIFEIFKIYAKYFVTLIFLYLSDYIILPSDKALKLYEMSIGKLINPNFRQIPLLFDDESIGVSCKRIYFSYIGTIAKDHAFNEFVKFIIKAVGDEDIPKSIKFLIATRNTVPQIPELLHLSECGRLKIIDGKPLTDSLINNCYASSIGIWNAYHRTTQSGVIAKASMFGTPAIICENNVSEFAISDNNVVCCNNNNDYCDLKRAFLKLYTNFDFLSKNAKSMFMKTFYYKIHNEKMRQIIHMLTNVNGGG